MTTTLPTIDAFRVAKNTTLPSKVNHDEQRQQILALASKGLTPTEITNKLYKGTLPTLSNPLTSPEGSPTIERSIQTRYNNFRDFVASEIEQVNGGA